MQQKAHNKQGRIGRNVGPVQDILKCAHIFCFLIASLKAEGRGEGGFDKEFNDLGNR